MTLFSIRLGGHIHNSLYKYYFMDFGVTQCTYQIQAVREKSSDGEYDLQRIEGSRIQCRCRFHLQFREQASLYTVCLPNGIG